MQKKSLDVNGCRADTAPMTSTDLLAAPLVIRRAMPADAAALADLAALDSARPLQGDVLLAEAGGAAVAALSADGRAIADPFAPTADVVDVLRVSAHRLRGDRRRGALGGLARLAPARLRPV
jgi:hypothetical protein